MNVTASVGGPALSVYGVVSRRSQVSFAATLQPLFVVMGAASVVAKVITDGGAAIDLPGWVWAAVAVAVLAGVGAGTWLSRHVAAPAARRLVVVLAYAGGLATLARGISGLV